MFRKFAVRILPALMLMVCLNLEANNNAVGVQDNPMENVVFKGEEFILPGYPGLYFRISEPYLRYNEWDTGHTGASWFSLALEFTNKSDQNISAITFRVKLLDKKGDIAWDGTSGTGPLTFKPEEVDYLKPGYKGVYDAFITQGKSFFDKFGEMEFSIMEIKTVGSISLSGPVFSGDWTVFKEFENLKFKWSDPYVYVDDLSGNERFGIALKFKNESGEALRRMYFQIKVYDMQGIVDEREIQEHNQRFDPPPKFFMDSDFPSEYEGIDYHFYSNEKSFVDVFDKIDIDLLRVEK